MRESEALFEEICRVAVEYGQFRMAWIGLVDEVNGPVKPVQFAGEELGYLSNININYLDEKTGRGPTPTSIREGHCIICQDIAADPRQELWRDQALLRGYRSSAAVPLRRHNVVIGALTVYAAESHGFDIDDENLLEEIGSDISYALDSMEAETQRKQAEQALAASVAELRALFASMQDVVLVIDRDGIYREVAPTNPTLLYKPSDELLGRNLRDVFPEEQAETFIKVIQQVVLMQQTTHIEYELAIGERVMWFDASISPMDAVSTIWVARDITRRKQAEQALRESEARYRTLVEGMLDGIYRSSHDGKFLDVNPAMVKMFGYSSREEMTEVDIKRDLYFSPHERESLFLDTGSEKIDVFRMRRKDGSEIWVEDHGHYVHDRQGNVIYHEGLLRDITERKRAEKLQAATYEIAHAGLVTQSLDELFSKIHGTLRELLHAEYFYIALYDKGRDLLSFPYFHDAFDVASPTEKPGHGLTEYLLRTRKPLLATREVMAELIRQGEVELIGTDSVEWMGVPLITKDDAIGVMVVQSYEENIRFSQRDMDIMTYVSTQIASAIERKQNETNLQNRASQFAALYQVAGELSQRRTLAELLNSIITEATQLFNTSNGSITLYDAERGDLVLAAAIGPDLPVGTRQLPGDGLAGRIAETLQPLIVNDYQAWEGRSIAHTGIHYSTVMGVPMLYGGELIGVLDVSEVGATNRQFTSDELDLLSLFAAQAAAAVHDARLYEDLQRANLELSAAYDATIEGWSRAMDLRDRETEGHTQRVTELTLSLARSMGFKESDLIHIRRGGLLHDIGKIGVPDNILLKYDDLTDEEWAIMRQHPAYAYEMLVSIDYLKPALDIPYCHHEKWDGTGYPRGLKGEQIPLDARIFAVVDVWDALRSDRPYRAAWSWEQALNYIREQSGKYFDPGIVEKFLHMITNS